MKRLFGFALTVLFALGFYGSPVMADQASGPVLEVDNREFDFREVKQGTLLEHAFKIFNKGDQELEIISVTPG